MPVAQKTGLLERGRELDALGRVLDRLQDAGSLLLVEGPAGIGKTRLLAEASDLALDRDLVVRRAVGGELERDLPFGIVRQLLEPLVERASEEERELLLSGSARLALGALGRPAPPADPLAAIDGLYWLLANIAESAPVLLAIDDLHWADAQTLRFLDYLARRLTDLPVLVVAAARSGEPDEPAGVERLRLQAELLRPRALSDRAVRELVTARLGADPGSEFAAACANATAGNPFLVTEVLRAVEADAIRPGRQSAAAIVSLGTDGVARQVLVRLARFGPEAVALCRAIAVLGGSPQLRHAAALADLDQAQARELSDRLRAAEILRPGLPLDFVHPLVRQAIYRELPEGERAVLHRRAADDLRSTGAGAREAAPHLLACPPNGDQWVVAQLGEAAWEAISASAFDAAQAYLERALREPPEDELPVRYALGRCMLQTDPVRAAETLVHVGERSPDLPTRVRALRHAGQGHMVTGAWAQTAACLEQLLEILPGDEREQRLAAEAELYVFSAAGRGWSEEASARIRSAANALRGSSAGECLARQALGMNRFMECAPVEEVVPLLRSRPSEVWHARSLVPLAACRILGRCGRWDEARQVTAAAVDFVHRSGLLLSRSYYLSVLSELDRFAGRLVDAEAEARTGLELASVTALFLNPGREGTLNLVSSLIARGELEEAGRLAEGADLSQGMADIPLSPWPLEVRGYLRIARGELEAGASDLLEFGEGAERFGARNPAISPWRQEAAPALAALDRTAEARDLIDVAETRARGFRAAHVIGAVLRSRALISPRSRRVRTLEESVTALEEYGPAHELARSLLELGGAMRREGRRSDARAPLRRALDLAHRCGAGGIEHQAREELAATGARPRRALLSGRDALTATERRIAGMAAEGLSNREIAQRLFVTPKTVENHLGRIYPKLGVGRRGELAAALLDSAN